MENGAEVLGSQRLGIRGDGQLGLDLAFLGGLGAGGESSRTGWSTLGLEGLPGPRTEQDSWMEDKDQLECVFSNS